MEAVEKGEAGPHGRGLTNHGNTGSIEALRRSEERLRLAIEGAELGTWHWDVVSGEVSWSDRASQLLGMNPTARMSQRRFLERVHPQDHDMIDQARAAATRSEVDVSLEFRVVWPDASVHWLAAKGRAFQGSNGRVRRVEGVVWDNTVRRLAEDEMRHRLELQQRLVDIAATAPGLLCSLRRSTTGTITMPYASPNIADFYGVEQEDVRDSLDPLLLRIPREDIQQLRLALDKSAAANALFEASWRYRHPRKGVRWIEARAIPTLAGDGGIVWNGVHTDVTDRRWADIATIESQRTYRSLFENLLNALVHCRIVEDESGETSDLVVVDVNRAFVEITGLHDAVGKRLSELLPDVKQLDGEFIARLAKIARTGEPERFETWLHSAARWLSVSAYCPQPGHFIALFDEVTERKRTDALSRLQARFMEMVASGAALTDVLDAIARQVEELDPGLLVSILLLDDDGKRLRHGAAPSLPAEYNRLVDGLEIGPNQGSCGTAAFLCEPVVVDDIATDPLWARFRDMALGHGLRSCWSTPIVDQAGNVLGTFAFYRRKSGSPRHHEDSIIAMATHAAAVAIVRDRAEQALRKLSTAVEQSADSVIITDLDGRIEYVNAAFCRISGYSREEALRATPAILQSGKTKPETFADLWRTLRRGETWRGEFVNRRKDGRDYYERCLITPLRKPDGTITHYLAIQSDVTETKRIAAELNLHRYHLEDLVEKRTAELALAKLEAEAASRAKGTFLANMSHEIRTPMNAILGLTYILQQGTRDRQQRDLLAKLHESAQHLMHVINGVLDLSKIEAGKLALEETEFSFSAILRNVVGLLAHEAQAKGLRLGVEAHGIDDVLRGDATRLTQALLNYLSNAIKFTSRGSVTIRVSVDAETDDEQLVRFIVQDTGPGIAAEHLGKLFSAFEQGDPSTTRSHGGTGLGLAITKGLAQLMNGEVGAESEPGTGSTFWFTARLGRTGSTTITSDSALREFRSSRAARATLPAQPQFAGRVLLAEDNPTNQFVVMKMLRDSGVSVDLADNGLQAVELARSRPYDLIFMDVQMPGMDGLAATRRIRTGSAHTDVPIVALTANAFTEDRDRCLEAGMDGFLPKPIDPALLREALERWLR